MENSKLNEKLFLEFPQITKDEWIKKIETDLKGVDYNKKLVWSFDENIRLQPFYMAEDSKEVSLPFFAKSDNNWEIRETVSVGELDKAGECIKRGADAITVTDIGDAEINVLKTLLDNVDMTSIPVHFSGANNYFTLLRNLKQAAREQGIDTRFMKGSIDFDFYAYYLLHGDYYGSREQNITELKEIFEYAYDLFPLFKLININADIYHNSGATIVQETAFALSHGLAYVSGLTDAGIDAGDVLSAMQFTFATGSSYFAQIAKIRALRYLWNVIASKYVDNETVDIYIHSVSSLWDKAVYDPYVNLLRTTTETMSAIIGGCDAVTVLPLDFVYKTPSEVSRRIARNQQIILKEEVNLWKVVDPAKGSYYIENLTGELIEKSWEMFLKTEDAGGFDSVVKSGFVFENIRESARKKDMDIAMRKINILGVNRFPNINEVMLPEIEKSIDNADNGTGLRLYRGAEAFELLRLKTEKYIAAGNKKPLVFLLTYGNLNMRKARANFALNFFGCAGFDVMDNNGFDTPAIGMKAAHDAGADIVVLCSSDEEYPEMVKQITDGMERIVVAGYPSGDILDEIKNAGVDKFIHTRSNVLEELDYYQKLLGIK